MSDIKIFVTHTPNRDTMRVNNSLFYNVIAGSDFQTKEVPEGVYQDNQGDNISSLNKSYCELTTQYWAWKNMQADYYGFCHYRRFFSFSEKKIKETSWGTIEYDFSPSATQTVYDNVKYIAFRDTYGAADANYYYQQRWNAHDQDETPDVREMLCPLGYFRG